MKKSRILYTLKFLYENSDEKNPVSSKQIMEYLTEQGFEVHRTTINADIALISEIGIDVVTIRSSPNKYFIGERTLEPMELKMLVDAVSSSKFITEKKSELLVKKIEKLTSKWMAQELHREMDITKVTKPTNERIYYTLDTIMEAIQNKAWIDFKYFEYTPHKQRVYRHDGYLYEVCPYTTFWRDDHYYVVGHCRKYQKVVVFRIDRIDGARIYEDAWLPPPSGFDATIYANEIFEMFDGEPVTVELKCENHLMDVIIDKFGEDVDTLPLGSKCFKATVDIRLSPRFYAWVFGFCGAISIMSPASVKEEFVNLAKKVVLSE